MAAGLNPFLNQVFPYKIEKEIKERMEEIGSQSLLKSGLSVQSQWLKSLATMVMEVSIPS